MNFDQFIREILRYDMEHTIIDKEKRSEVWNHIIEGISYEKSGKPEQMKYP